VQLVPEIGAETFSLGLVVVDRAGDLLLGLGVDTDRLGHRRATRAAKRRSTTSRSRAHSASWTSGQGFGEFVLQSLVTPSVDAAPKHWKTLEKLRRAHAKVWLGPVLSRCAPDTARLYRRGLPAHIAGDARDLVRVVPDALLKAPRATLSVMEMAPNQMNTLLPLLTGLPGDQLLTRDFDEDAVVALGNAGGLARFTHAKLLCPLSRRAFEMMAQHARNLDSLAIGMATDLGTLLSSGLALRKLHFVTDRLTDALASYDLPLDTLVAAIDDFDDADIDRLLARPSSKHLWWLGLSRRNDAPTGLTSAGAVRLVRGLPSLRTLNLGGTFALSADAAAEIEGLLSGAIARA
jgi:hypothetical protein